MDAAAEIGRNPVSTRFSLSMEMSRLTRDGTAKPVSRDQILRRERGQGNIHQYIHFLRSAGHEQDWQLYPVATVYVMTVHCCQTFFSCSLFPVQQTTSGIGHRVK